MSLTSGREAISSWYLRDCFYRGSGTSSIRLFSFPASTIKINVLLASRSIEDYVTPPEQASVLGLIRETAQAALVPMRKHDPVGPRARSF